MQSRILQTVWGHEAPSQAMAATLPVMAGLVPAIHANMPRTLIPFAWYCLGAGLIAVVFSLLQRHRRGGALWNQAKANRASARMSEPSACLKCT
jgi:hypothetical protein